MERDYREGGEERWALGRWGGLKLVSEARVSSFAEGQRKTVILVRKQKWGVAFRVEENWLPSGRESPK